MSVMKQAHAMTRDMLAVLAGLGEKATYRAAFRHCLKLAHKALKRMIAGVAATITKNTYQLKTGDTIRVYGAILKLKARHVYDDCVAFDTECLFLGPTMPADWAYRPNGYRIQGNANAQWAAFLA